MTTHRNAYTQVHYRWDVDKTYIQTDFDSTRALIRAWRQTPEEKRNIPGAPALLRELLQGKGEEQQVTFISGSPQQMRSVLMQKFALDGIQPDRFILKPNLSNILKLRLRDVHNQIGYKLRALISSRSLYQSEYLFGDDSEQDGLIYSLYGDLLEGRVVVDELQEFLQLAGLYDAEVERLVQAYLAMTPKQGRVERVFIHLDRRSPVSRFAAYGWRVVPVYNYFQAGVVLFDMGMLDARALSHIVDAMALNNYTPARLANSLQDLVRRGYATQDLARRVSSGLQALGRSDSAVFQRAFEAALRGLPETTPVQELSRELPDYRTLFEAERYRRSPKTITGREWLTESS